MKKAIIVRKSGSKTSSNSGILVPQILLPLKELFDGITGKMKQKRCLALIVCMLFLNFALTGQDIRIQSFLDQYNPDSVQTQIKRLSGEIPVVVNGQALTIHSRLYNNPGNENTFQYCKQLFSGLGYVTGQQVFSTNGKNLFAVKTGTTFPERVCIIGAHYDDVPTGSIAPGADDNASGVAAVLEIARIMSASDFPNTLVFALWDEEELGLIGSDAYTEGTIHGKTLLGYINLDMIGWDGNNDRKTELQVRPVANSLSLASLVLEAREEYGISLELKVVNPGSVNTDHYSFWKKGLTAVGINEEYTGDFNPNYHSTGDLFSELNLLYLDENVKLVLASFSTLAYSMTNNEALEHLLVYPNPASEEIHLNFGKSIDSPITFKVSDNTGRVLIHEIRQNTHEILLDVSSLATGRYLVTLFIDGETNTFSIVKD